MWLKNAYNYWITYCYKDQIDSEAVIQQLFTKDTIRWESNSHLNIFRMEYLKKKPIRSHNYRELIHS